MKFGKYSENELFFFKTRKFFEWLNVKKGKSHSNNQPSEDATVKSYRDALTIFRRFIVEKKNYTVLSFRFEDCDRDIILDFIKYLEEEKRSKATINQRLAAIKSYLWFCSDEDITLQPLSIMISRIPNVKETKKVRERLSEDDLKLIFSLPKNSRIGIRDKTIMILLYDSAIRVSELTGLNIGDVYFKKDGTNLIVHGKGNKERVIAISDRTSEYLRLYNTVYNESAKKDDPLFFTVYKGVKDRMSSGNVERIIKKYADIARSKSSTIPKSVYPHMFRRTRATDMYQNGVELDLVSRILGHETVETTRSHYAVPSQEMLKQSMERAGANLEKPEWEKETDEEILKYLDLR